MNKITSESDKCKEKEVDQLVQVGWTEKGSLQKWQLKGIQNDQKKPAMERAGGREFQIQRTANAKASKGVSSKGRRSEQAEGQEISSEKQAVPISHTALKAEIMDLDFLLYFKVKCKKKKNTIK